MRGAAVPGRDAEPAFICGAVSTARMLSSVARVLSSAGASSLMVVNGSR